MRHTHVLRQPKRTVTMTVDEWPDFVYFHIASNGIATEGDYRALNSFLIRILTSYNEDSRALHFYDAIGAGEECRKGFSGEK